MTIERCTHAGWSARGRTRQPALVGARGAGDQCPVVGLDLFVLSLALPTLAVDLHASTGDLQWFVDAYSLVLAAALLPAGLLGDRIGRKQLLIGALAVFGMASLSCAYSASTGELIAARAVLGLAAAVILPLALAVLPVMFTPEERPKAIAVVGGATRRCAAGHRRAGRR